MKFIGWYFKLEAYNDLELTNIAFIVGKSSNSNFIQVIGRDFSYFFEFNDFYYSKKDFYIKIDNNIFCRNFIKLDIKQNNISICGKVIFSQFRELKYHIMGPLKYLKLKCMHEIISMNSLTTGLIEINKNDKNTSKKFTYSFRNNFSYIESDYGKSFPKSYFWFNSLNEVCSIVSSVAYLNKTFVGFFAVISFNKDQKEIRLATYLGGRIVLFSETKIILKQFNYTLIIEVKKNNPQKLLAPFNGRLINEVYEDIESSATIKLYKNNKVLLDITTSKASSEFYS